MIISIDTPSSTPHLTPPTITKVTPNRGPLAGGQTITIDGEHFLDGATVLIGGIEVVPLSITPTRLTFTTPPSTEGAKPMVVRNVDAKVGFVDNGYTYTDIEFSPADINGDVVINILDLVLVASEFGQSGDDLTGDVNSDGTVNVLDLVFVASQFGQLPPAAPDVE